MSRILFAALLAISLGYVAPSSSSSNLVLFLNIAKNLYFKQI